MNNKLILIFLAIFSSISAICQQLPLNDCGIVLVYDAAGNRTKRVYYCNNPNYGPYPQRINSQAIVQANNNDTKTNSPFTTDELANMEVQQIDALYPNPSSGIFYMLFKTALDNAAVSILGIHGNPVRNYRLSGTKISFDLSTLPASTYFLRINDRGNIIIKKLIKL